MEGLVVGSNDGVMVGLVLPMVGFMEGEVLGEVEGMLVGVEVTGFPEGEVVGSSNSISQEHPPHM